MRIALADETRQRIRDVLGNDVDLDPEVVPTVLARLSVEAPAVYSQVLEELSGSQIQLDSEAELRRRRRRSLLRRLLFSWGEYETAAGDRVLEKRHIAAAVPLALALLTAVLLGITLISGRRTVPSVVPHPAAVRSPVRGGDQEGRRWILSPRSLPVVPEESLRRRPSPSRPTGQAPTATTLPSVPSGLPGFPDTAGLMGRLGGPVVVTPQTGPDRETARTPEPPRATSPVVYNRAADADPQRRDGSGGLSDPTPARERGAAGADSAAAAVPFAPGARLSARLATGALVVPGGPPVPVVVESEDPHGTWVGQAVAGPGDRVQMTLTLTAQRRKEGARAIALDPAGSLPGLPGRTTMRHASAAAALAAAALQASSDYAQAVARQGSLGVSSVWGPLVLGGQVPEPWTYLASRLAQDFQARGTQAGWVTTIEIPAGTPLIILITGAS